MKNSADQGGCYPQRPKAEVDYNFRDLQNSSYPTKALFNNCFIIHSKYFLLLKGVSPLHSLFFRSPNITQPCPQVFSVNGSIICNGLHFWRHFDVLGSIIFGGLYFWRDWFNMAKILSKFGEQQLVMVNYACGFNESETGKYFEWIINLNICSSSLTVYVIFLIVFFYHVFEIGLHCWGLGRGKFAPLPPISNHPISVPLVLKRHYLRWVWTKHWSVLLGFFYTELQS